MKQTTSLETFFYSPAPISSFWVDSEQTFSSPKSCVIERALQNVRIQMIVYLDHYNPDQFTQEGSTFKWACFSLFLLHTYTRTPQAPWVNTDVWEMNQ